MASMSKFNWYSAAEWFEMWVSDHKHIETIMYSNMTSDLENGYDVNGKSITEQKAMIEAYHDEWTRKLMAFSAMDENTVGRWCYHDMIRRGVIE